MARLPHGARRDRLPSAVIFPIGAAGPKLVESQEPEQPGDAPAPGWNIVGKYIVRQPMESAPRDGSRILIDAELAPIRGCNNDQTLVVATQLYASTSTGRTTGD